MDDFPWFIILYLSGGKPINTVFKVDVLPNQVTGQIFCLSHLRWTNQILYCQLSRSTSLRPCIGGGGGTGCPSPSHLFSSPARLTVAVSISSSVVLKGSVQQLLPTFFDGKKRLIGPEKLELEIGAWQGLVASQGSKTGPHYCHYGDKTVLLLSWIYISNDRTAGQKV